MVVVALAVYTFVADALVCKKSRTFGDVGFDELKEGGLVGVIKHFADDPAGLPFLGSDDDRLAFGTAFDP